MRNRSRANDLLLLSLGATVGLIAGAVVIDRVGGLDRLLRRARRGGAPADALASEAAEAPYGLHDADGAYEEDLAHDEPLADDAPLPDHDDDALEGVEYVPAGPRGSGAGLRRAVPDVLTLETRVLEAFHNDPVLRERAIDIGAIAPGVIELTGWVHADDEVKHALTLARGVPDVEHVVNQLAVRQPRRNRRATDRLALDLADDATETTATNADAARDPSARAD